MTTTLAILASLLLLYGLISEYKNRKAGTIPLKRKEVIPTVRIGNNESSIEHILEEGKWCVDYLPRYEKYIVFSCQNGESLKLSETECHKDDNVTNLVRMTYGWPEGVRTFFLKDHPLGNTHYLFPSSWLHPKIQLITKIS